MELPALIALLIGVTAASITALVSLWQTRKYEQLTVQVGPLRVQVDGPLSDNDKKRLLASLASLDAVDKTHQTEIPAKAERPALNEPPS